jgi:eukaryotic-like serine/threonine-protein kinase
MSERDPKALLGEVVAGRYRLDDIIATGGMGAVYRGEHVHMRKQVAIKLLHPETEKLPELVQRFERESIVGAHASHPNVASASDFGKDPNGTYYLVLEYIEGITLRQLLRKGPLDFDRACDIARKIALGLEAIHKLGIVHRDLGPRNVMVSGEPPDDVKLIDFGFAKVPLEKFAKAQQVTALTSKGIVFGTVGFMAPEAGFGMHAVTARSDLYSLGVIFYEMLTGKHPFDHKDERKLFQAHSFEEPPPPSRRAPERHVPPAIERVILRLLEKAPDNRYPDAHAFIDALDTAVAETALSENVDAEPVPRHPGPSDPAVPFESPLSESARSERSLRESDPEPRGATSRQTRPKRRGALGWWLFLLVVAGAGAAVLLVPGLMDRLANLAAGGPSAPPAPPVVPPTTADVPATAAPTVAATAEETPEPAPVAAPRPTEIDGLDAAGWLIVMREAAKAQDAGRSARAFEAIAKIDPARLGDPVVVPDAAAAVVVAAAGGDLSKPTFALFEGPELGEAGPDVLYRIINIYGGSQGAKRAGELLEKEDVLRRASPALKIALELSRTPCRERPALFDRAVAEGDDRALAILVAMTDADCMACCLRAEPSLPRAINDLRQRLRG